MRSRQRLLATLRGQPTDRIPWSPFLAYFWEAQPASFQERGQLAFLQEIGADPLLRGFIHTCKIEFPGCETHTTERNGWQTTEIRTPVGSLHSTARYSPAGNTWFLQEHPLKTEADYQVFLSYLERARITPNEPQLSDELERYGDDALLLPLVGLFGKTGFQSMVEHWVGTEELAYALADFPAIVEEVLATLYTLDIETVTIAAHSKADAFIFWEDSSTTNISPAWFNKYTAPTLQAWGEILHAHEKLLIHHACGHMRALLGRERELPVDAIESLSPPPTGNIEVWEARKILGSEIGIIGGIEPTVFLYSTEEELRIYVYNLLRRTSPHKFILANSDSCPPGVSLRKFALVSDIVRDWANHT